MCLDIKKTYDTISKSSIINALIKLDIKVLILAFIKNFLASRTIQVKISEMLSSIMETRMEYLKV